MGAFLLKGRRDGFANLSFPVVPSICPPPQWAFIYLVVWRSNTHLKKTKKHSSWGLSLPNINKVYTPDLNVPLLLIVLHRCREKKGRKWQTGRRSTSYQFVFVVWHRERVYKSSDSSHPVSARRGAEGRRCRRFQAPPPGKVNFTRVVAARCNSRARAPRR